MSLFRSWRSPKHPGAFAFTPTLTVTLGVAALTTAFGIVNAALFRQPPFAEAGRLAMLYLVREDPGAPRRQRWSFARIELLRQSQKSFERVAHYTPATLALAGDTEAETVRGEFVASSYFPLLRVSPLQGRTFNPSEDSVSSPAPVVMLARSLVRRRWPAGSNPIGGLLRLNGVVLTVIGVMPEGFHGLSGQADLWIPATMAPRLTYAEYLTTNQNFISLVGRLRPGVGFASARNELAVLGAAVNRALPSNPDAPAERVEATAVSLNDARTDRTVRRSLLVFFGAVALLHLLACANVTNLLLGRAAGRRRDAAVRLALGSRPSRLFAQLLGDGMLLAGVGGAIGVALAWWASGVLAPPANVWAPRNFYGSLAPFDTPAFHLGELAFAAGLIVVTAFVVALPAALTAFRLDVAAGIRAAGRAIAVGALRVSKPTARGVLVGLEAALAMLLVIAAGLLIASFERMRQTPIGIDPSGLLTFWVIPSEVRVPPATAPAFVSRLIDVVARVPGVVSATVDGGAPMGGTASSVLYVAGHPIPRPGQAPVVLRHYVAPNHFRTLGIPLLRGRGFTSADGAGAPHVTVISAGAARRFWPDQDPLGQRVWFGSSGPFGSPDSAATIVGIVGDVVYAPLDQHPNPASFYTPYAQFTYASRLVFVRTAEDPLALVPGLRKALRSLDPDLSMRDVQPLTEVVSGSWARHRFDAILFGGFGLAALVLAASGIFAVLAYAVANRTREFGIRLALGANSARLMGLVIREGMGFPLVGLLVGVLGALGSTRLLQASLYEVSPLDLPVFLRTAAVLIAVSVAACLLPAWRATRADPVETLRAE